MTAQDWASRPSWLASSAGQLAYFETGPKTGQPVLLVHGGGFDCSATAWVGLAERLSSYRLIAIDLPGFGYSHELPPIGEPAKMADLVAEVIKKLAIARPVLIGHSMGGDIGLQLALAYPDLAKAFVFVAPAGLARFYSTKFGHKLAYLAMRCPDCLVRPCLWLARRFAKLALTQVVADVTRLSEQTLIRYSKYANLSAIIGWADHRYNQATIGKHGMKNDLLAHISKIKQPVLFIHGSKDRIVFLDDSKRGAALIPNAELLVYPDCGHWPAQEYPDRFAADLAAFLGEIS